MFNLTNLPEPMTTQQIPLKIRNLTKYYGSLCAVDQVSFEIYEGEIFGLLGPNGAGKTSIISMITTLEEITQGSIEIFGYPITKYPRKAKALIGCVPQELVHHGFFTVEEILQIHSGYYGILNNKEQIEFILEKLALNPHRKKKVKELSGGLKRRLMIAKALVHKPKLILLDEPTAGVDIELRLKLWEFVRELRHQGTSILLTTHYLEEAEHLCDRVAFLNLGVLKVVDETKKLIEEYTFREVMVAFKDPIGEISHPYLVGKNDHELLFHIPASKSIGELIAELPIPIKNLKDLTIREGNLEGAFKTILGRSQ